MTHVVQSFWFGSRLPSLQVLSLRSFLAHGHDYHLYTFEPVDNVPDGVRVIDATEILPRDSVFTYQHGFGRGSASAFSNLFRYKLLHERGGWWVDTDVVALRPFDLDGEFVFATERDKHGGITTASCVIKSPAGAEYLRYCLDECQRRDKTTIVWGEIGPRLVDQAIGRFNLERFRLEPDVFNPIDYSSFRDVQAPGFEHARLSRSYGVHLWNQKWKTYCLNPDYDGAPDSLYATLRRQYMRPGDCLAGPDAAQAHLAFQQRSLEALGLERDEFQHVAESSTQELAELRDELNRTRGALEALRQSASWRLTAPLRAIVDRLKTPARSDSRKP